MEEVPMRMVIYTLAFGFFVVAVPPLQTQTKQPGAVSQLMAKKLASAKTLLEGIALADFKKIRRSAEDLNQLTKTEEWHAIKTPRYDMFSNEFRRAAEGIIQKAQARNIDGVTLSYFELTMSCVRCHQYVREVREARRPGPVDPSVLLARGHRNALP
jgi:hypothetical protein